MKSKPTRIVWADPASSNKDSDLEDGELPGEKADEYDAVADPPRKQRKLAHGEDADKSRRQGGAGSNRPATKQESYNTQARQPHQRGHQQEHGGQHQPQQQAGVGGSAKRKDHSRRDQQHNKQHQEPQRDHHEHGADKHKRKKQQQQQQQQQHSNHAHKAQQGGAEAASASAGAGAGTGAGGDPAGSAAAKSAAFEARKASLKARLQSLEDSLLLESPEGAKGGGGGGGHGGAAAGSAATPTHGAGRGKQPATGASPAAASSAAAAGVGGGKYVVEVYKEAVPSVEIKGGSGSGSSPHPIRLSDVNSLVLWTLSPAGNVVEAPRWAFVKNKPLVDGVVLVLANGLSSAMMRHKKHLLPFLSSLGQAAIVHTHQQAKPAQNTAELLTTKATLRNVKRKRSGGEAFAAAPAAAAAAAGKVSNAGGTAAAVKGQQPDQAQAQNGAGGDSVDGGGDSAAGGSPPPPPPPPAGVTLPAGPFPPSHYVASVEELKQHKYPLPYLEEEGEGEEEEGERRGEEGEVGGGRGGGGGGGSGGAGRASSQAADATGRLVCPPGFVATRPSGDPTARERMVALDCEMCITEAGFELTRITLVAGPGWEPGTAAGAAAAAMLAQTAAASASGRNGAAGGDRGGKDAEEDDDGQGEGDGFGGGSGGGVPPGGGARGFPSGAVLLDELVVPERPILDYNTRYSGITAKMLQGCTNRLEDVRERFLSLVSSETLLVGHALENDLAALRTCHCRVLDTAVLFPHPKGPPFKSALKILARRFLRRNIQDGAHDSAVDACTALDLTLLKIKHGPSYGCGNCGPHASAPKLAEVLTAQCGTRCCLVDRHDVLSRFVSGSTAAVPVASDDDAVATAGRQAASRTYGFVWTQLTELSVFMFRRARHKARLEEVKAAEAALAAAEAKAAEATGAEAAAPRGTKQRTPAAAAGAAGTVAAMAANGKGGSAHGTHGTPHGGAAAAAAAAVVAAAAPAAAAAAAAAVAGGSSSGGRAAAGNSNGTSAGSGPGSAAQPDYSDAVLDQILVSYDKRLRKLWEALPPRYMLVIATGAGDTAEYDRLYEQKCKRGNRELGLPPWTLREEDALVELAASVMQGLCFAVVKAEGGGVSGAAGGCGGSAAGGGGK